jgi:ubiquitin carboxyl-terminal hydrolase 7
MSIYTSPTVEFANLELNGQDPFHPDATSPNAMMIDPPEELAIDSPEANDVQLNDGDQALPDAPPKPLATDCRSSVASSCHAGLPC